MKRYAIWNKTDPIITPRGEVLTAEQWMNRYPVAKLDTITVVCAAGEINGAIFNTLGNMVFEAQNMGCDFSNCKTDEERLEAIEAFEDERNKPSAEPTAEQRTAAALEAMASGATAESTAVVDALLGEDEEV